jgi:hypothetical protein
LIIGAGFICFIIPGIYLAVTLSLTPYIYLEFHHMGVGIIDSIVISRRVIHKKFWWWLLFGIVAFLIAIALSIPLITVFLIYPWFGFFSPVIMNIVFNLKERPVDKSCFCCCGAQPVVPEKKPEKEPEHA